MYFRRFQYIQMMNNKIALIVATFLMTSIGATAQVTYKKVPFTIKKTHTVNPREIQPAYAPKLESLEAPSPDGPSYKSFVLKQKQISSTQYPRKQSSVSYKSQATAPDPHIEKGLMMYRKALYPNGDTTLPAGGGSPLDNTMAVSNNGILMGSVNSNVWAYDLNADTAMFKNNDGYAKTISFIQFAKPGVNIDPSEFPFDPKLVYDPIHDRFILIFLSGRGPSDSKNVVGFSSTNNPLDPWHFYQITGNPNGVNEWTDYPAFALTENELFLTINLIEQGVSWQQGFRGSIIWQVKLEDGYQGKSTLTTHLWKDIKYGGKLIRNLNPIKGAHKPMGPNMYFISNRNFDVQNDSIFLVEVTDSIGGSSSLNVKLGKLDEKYGMPPNGRQQDTDASNASSGLQTNDARWLGGFLLNNEIQFVGNTKNFTNGNAGIYHGFIKNVNSSSPTFTGKIISVDSLDFGYPNIAYVGTNPAKDKNSIIAFNHSSKTTHPGMSAVYYSNSGDYSNIVRLKEGEGYVNKHSSPTGLNSYERWGDYFGLQRIFNEPGKVWAAGFYGLKTNQSNTWFSKVSLTPGVSDNSDEKSAAFNQSKVESNLYPNPFIDRFTVDFYLENEEDLQFRILDLKGAEVVHLGTARGTKGANRFSFSMEPLTRGMYFLKIVSGDKELVTKQIVKH